ncbi:MAG: hypothetical protein WCK32_05095 [Chlorobiaceae bacterium]
MKTKLTLVAALLLSSLASPCSDVVAAEKKVGFEVSAGFVVSSDYHDFLDNYYGLQDGGWGWAGIGAGVKFNVSDQVSIIPGADFMLNSVSYEGSSDSDTNFIFLPKIAARYRLEPKLPSLFVEAELNDNIPSTDLYASTFESGGIGYGGMIGYELRNGLSIQAGYKYIPVKVSVDTFFGTIKSTENMGGFVVKAGVSF